MYLQRCNKSMMFSIVVAMKVPEGWVAFRQRATKGPEEINDTKQKGLLEDRRANKGEHQ